MLKALFIGWVVFGLVVFALLLSVYREIIRIDRKTEGFYE